MKQGICLLSIIPVRKDPAEKSEMVSQLLFGEAYAVKKETSGWYKILTQFDQYAGWIDRRMFSPVSDEYYRRLEQGGYAVSASTITSLAGPDHASLVITAGSTLNRPVKGIIEIDSIAYRIMDPVPESVIPLSNDLMDTAKQFLNSPYLWGGRSPFGFDCSGFTQIVYKINGIKLPRDASQQAAMGKAVNSLKELNEGDLAFFCNEVNRVVHVGIAMTPDKIIHCSGMVRIDRLDEKGIFNLQLNQYTHTLHSVRRLI